MDLEAVYKFNSSSILRCLALWKRPSLLYNLTPWDYWKYMEKRLPMFAPVLLQYFKPITRTRMYEQQGP